MSIGKIKEFLDEVAKQTSYFHIHGGDVLLTIFYFFFFWIIIGFLKLKKKSVELKKKWPEVRCDPSITPFAGFLNPPPGTKSFAAKMKFTMDNYAVCNSEILSSNVSFFAQPINAAQTKVRMMFGLIGRIMGGIQVVIQTVKDALFDVIDQVFNKIYGVVIEVQKFLIQIKDLLMKSGGLAMGLLMVNVASSYLTIATLNNFSFTIGMILIILFVAVVILGIISKIPLFGIWAIPPYIAVLIVYLFYTILGTLVIIYVEYIKTVKQEQECKASGEEPCCFHPNTTLKVGNNYKQIKDIKLGDELDHGNYIESIIVVEPNSPLYSYGGIFVTGKHCVYENNKLIFVKDSKKSRLTNVKAEKYYCIQTSKKYFYINSIKFADWDDLDHNDIDELKKRYSLNTVEELNDKFNSGVREDTLIKLQNNIFKPLRKVSIGDVLENNNLVIGKALIESPKYTTFYYDPETNNGFYGSNLYFTDLGDKIKRQTYLELNKNKKYYQLITTKKYFKVNNHNIGDINWAYEIILDKYNYIFKK